MAQRVLVVDDNDAMAKATADGLAKAGFAADVAFDGEEGLELILANDYAVVVTDIAMPTLSGIEMLTRAQAQKGKMHAVVLSGVGGLPAELSHASFLLKPVTLAQVVDAVNAQLAKPL